MGYAYYDFEDGHGPRGYSVEAVCALDGCGEKIDKGMAYLCYSCTNYFCGPHLTIAIGSADKAIKVDCFAGESTQCCHNCAKEAEKTAD